MLAILLLDLVSGNGFGQGALAVGDVPVGCILTGAQVAEAKQFPKVRHGRS